MASVETYFENIEQEIVKCIDNANASIIVVVAWFKNEVLFSALSRALYRDVKIHIAINDDEINFGNNALDFSILHNSGANIYLIGGVLKNLVHHKFCVIDDTIVINGSYNWTNKAKFNHENVVVIKDSHEVAKSFISEFYRLTKSFGKLREGIGSVMVPKPGSLDALAWWEKLSIEWKCFFAQIIFEEWHNINAEAIDKILLLESLEVGNSVSSYNKLMNSESVLKDFKPLYSLCNLRNLVIKNDFVNSLSFVTSMKNLQSVCIEAKNVNDFAEFAACFNLHTIRIRKSGHVDLNFISKLENIKVLEIGRSQIDDKLDLKPIEGLSLQSLFLYDLDIVNFSSISRIDKIEKLHVSRVVVDNEKNFAYPSTLKELAVGDKYAPIYMQQLSSIYDSIESLSIGNVQDVNNIDKIEKFKKLKSLTIHNSEITNINFVSNLYLLFQNYYQ